MPEPVTHPLTEELDGYGLTLSHSTAASWMARAAAELDRLAGVERELEGAKKEDAELEVLDAETGRAMIASIGRALAFYRVRAGLRQGVVTVQCGLSWSYVSLIENGHRTPSLSTLQKLANAYRVPVSRIVAKAEQIEEASP